MKCVYLLNPRYGRGSRYLIGGGARATVYEIQRVAQHPSSWFIGNHVESNGSFFVCTPVDSLFLALPLLVKARKQSSDQEGYFVGLSQILKDSDHPDAALLAPSLSEAQLTCLCDVKDGWDAKVFRLNDDKVNAWLKKKVERLSLVMATHPSCEASMCSEGLAKDRAAKIGALGLLSEYVSPEVLTTLAGSYNISSADLVTKKQPVKKYMDDSVSADADTSRSIEDMASTKKAVAPKAVNKKLAKTNTKGMKSLSSYFGGGGPSKKQKK